MSDDLSNKELLAAINKGFESLEEKMATKDDLKDVRSEMATKNDLVEVEKKLTKEVANLESEMSERFDDVDTQLDQIAEFVKDHTSRINALEESEEETETAAI